MNGDFEVEGSHFMFNLISDDYAEGTLGTDATTKNVQYFHDSDRLVDNIVNQFQTETEMAKDVFICNACGSRFYYKKNVTLHIKETHSPDDFIYNDSEYRVEAMTPNQRHPCMYCGKQFLKMNKLNIHTKTHIVSLQVSCEFCQKRFLNSTLLKKHLEKREKQLACPLCQDCFCDTTSLFHHRRQYHASGMLSCDVCNKSFPMKILFISHKLIGCHLQTGGPRPRNPYLS